MAFRREVDDARAAITDDASHGHAIGDVAVDETITWIVANVLEVGEIAGVGEQVQINNADIGIGFEKIADEIAADEAAAARDQDRTSHGDPSLDEQRQP